MVFMRIDNKFQLKETIFLKTDQDQLPRLIVAIKVLPENGILYEVCTKTSCSYHYDFEMSNERDVLLATTN